MMEIIDLHCHILPYVDDGAEDQSESLALLRMQAEQGVTRACATPHLRLHMFESTDETILGQFELLKSKAESEGIPVELFLSREYHCDEEFFDRLEKGKVIPYGKGSVVLAEFSSRHSEAYIRKYTDHIVKKGYTPLIAHVERCQAVRGSADLLKELKKAGALIQVNADALLGEEGFATRSFCRKLAKEELIDVIASDAHDPVSRPPRLLECQEWLSRKCGQAYTKKIMNDIPEAILSGNYRRD